MFGKTKKRFKKLNDKINIFLENRTSSIEKRIGKFEYKINIDLEKRLCLMEKRFDLSEEIKGLEKRLDVLCEVLEQCFGCITQSFLEAKGLAFKLAPNMQTSLCDWSDSLACLGTVCVNDLERFLKDGDPDDPFPVRHSAI